MSQLALNVGQTPRIQRSARTSTDGTYRYALVRCWDVYRNILHWVMLNPSTADAEVDDPTVRRVVRFTRDAGYGGAVIVNLFALRATDPSALRSHPDPVGPDNDWVLGKLAGGLELEGMRFGLRPAAVAAWGAKAPADRVRYVLKILQVIDLWCLGTTKAGRPRHPLYVPADQPLVPFRWAGA